MTAGELLVQLSGLTSATAAIHLLSITTGAGGTIVSDGVSVELVLDSIQVEAIDMDVEIEIQIEPVTVEVVTDSIEVQVQSQIELELP